MFSCRTAQTSDLDRLVTIHRSSFPDDRGEEARLRNFRSNPLGAFDDLRVVEWEGTVVGHAFLFSLITHYGGKRVPTAGIASVGIAPEARGLGIGQLLISRLHELAIARGDSLAMLYGFRQGFYFKLGYASSTPFKVLRFSPKSIGREIAAEARKRGVTVRPATGADRGGIEAAHFRAGQRGSGQLVRPIGLWERRYVEEVVQWFVAERCAEIVGYLAFRIRQKEPHASTYVQVDEFVADDGVARHALLGLLGALRDQVFEISLSVAFDDPLERLLVDADSARHGTEELEHPLGEIAGGPLVRILDIGRALSDRGYAADGDALLCLGAEDGTWHLKVRDGVGRAERVDGQIDRIEENVLHMDRRHLSALLFGGLRLRDAVGLEWVRLERGKLELLDWLFALPAPWNTDAF